MDERIAITGISAWSCFGRGIEPLVEALASSARGDRPITGMLFADNPWFSTRQAMRAEPEGSAALAPCSGVPRDWPLRMALETALDAWRAAGLEGARLAPHRVAVANGTSHGTNHGLLEYLRARALGEPLDATLLLESASWLARRVAQCIGARGPNLTFNTACSSGLNSIGQAARLLASGRIDCALAGGHDTFSLLSYAGFTSLRAVDPQGCRPFDVRREGMSLGDAAAYCVLERERDALRRGARVLALVTGYASLGEGYHPTAPDPEGRGALQVMTRALQTDERPQELTFVSAHGTGTPANDSAEAGALQRLAQRFELPGPVRVSSLKSQAGHSLGAAGALQVIATVACMLQGLIPGTSGLEQPVPHQPPLEFPTRPSRGAFHLALCNSFGFAGSTAALCLRAASAPPEATRRQP